jgi:hypothetical protein
VVTNASPPSHTHEDDSQTSDDDEPVTIPGRIPPRVTSKDIKNPERLFLRLHFLVVQYLALSLAEEFQRISFAVSISKTVRGIESSPIGEEYPEKKRCWFVGTCRSQLHVKYTMIAYCTNYNTVLEGEAVVLLCGGKSYIVDHLHAGQKSVVKLMLLATYNGSHNYYLLLASFRKRK